MVEFEDVCLRLSSGQIAICALLEFATLDVLSALVALGQPKSRVRHGGVAGSDTMVGVGTGRRGRVHARLCVDRAAGAPCRADQPG